MAARSDIKLLDALVQHKCISFQEAAECASVPLIEIEMEGTEFDKYRQEIISTPPDDIAVLNDTDLLFRDFCTALIYRLNGVAKVGWWLYLSLLDKNDPIDMDPRGIENVEMQLGFSMFGDSQGLKTGLGGFAGAISINKQAYCTCIVSTMYTDKGKIERTAEGLGDLTPKGIEQIEDDIKAKVINTLYYSRFNLERHRYRVGVRPKNPLGGLTMGRKKLLAQRSGPKVLWLDRMPTTPQEAEEAAKQGTKGIKVGRRRAYRKTLSNERFIHHEKYLVYKGVYVRDSWTGPRQTEVAGNIYKVMEEGI